MIEEWVLDDPDLLARADAAGVLLDLASAGATVRTAVRLAGEAGLDRIRPEGRPRAVFVAGHGTAALAGDLLAALGGGGCPINVLRPTTSDEAAGPGTGFVSGLLWSLPGWAGPSDLLIVLSVTGGEPGLTALLEQTYGRGCSIVVVAPPESALFEAGLQTRGLPLPYLPPATGFDRPFFPGGDLPREAPSALWGLLAPALALADLVGAVTAPPASVQAAADRLDETAVRCRPGAETYGNPAKTLAVQLDGVLPLLWSDGPVTAAAALRFTAVLADLAGRPTLSGMLPEVLTAQRGLLAGHLAPDPDEDDFFRDRTEDGSELRLKVLLLHRSPSPDESADPRVGGVAEPGQPDRGPAGPLATPAGLMGPAGPSVGPAAGAPTSRRVLDRARRLADDHQIAVGELSSGHPDDLEALAELIALADFAAAYSGLAGGAAGTVHEVVPADALSVDGPSPGIGPGEN